MPRSRKTPPRLIVPPGVDRIVREPERLAVTGVPPVTWWRMERRNEAPRRVSLSRHSNAVGWRLSELLAWQEGLTAPPAEKAASTAKATAARRVKAAERREEKAAETMTARA